MNWFRKQITKFVKRMFQGRSENFMKFQTGVSKFQFKVSFSTSKSPIGVSRLYGTLEPFSLLLFERQHRSKLVIISQVRSV